AMKEYQERLDCRLDTYFSPQFIYDLREDTREIGMHGRNLMDILSEYGCCLETSYAYGSTSGGSIPQAAFNEARQFKIQSYARVSSVQGLKQALVHNGPCL